MRQPPSTVTYVRLACAAYSLRVGGGGEMECSIAECQGLGLIKQCRTDHYRDF